MKVLLLLFCVGFCISYKAPSPPAEALQRDVNAAIANKDPLYKITSGDYYFNDTPFLVTGAAAFTLMGNTGVTLWFSPGFGVIINDCTNTTISTFAIDYSPPPMVYGNITKIISINGDQATVLLQLDPTSDTPENYIAKYPPHDLWPPIAVFNSKTKDLRCRPCGWGQEPSGTKISDRVYQYNVCPASSQVGDIVVIPSRFGYTYVVANSSEVTSQNIHIHHSTYFGVEDLNGGGNNVYSGVQMVSPYPNRPLASNADGFHSSGSTIGPTITDCVIKNINDDFFNVHNTLQLVALLLDSRTLLAIEPHLFSGASNTIYGTFEVMSRLKAGNLLSIYGINTVAPANVIFNGTITQIQVNTSDNSKLIQQTYDIANKMAHGCPLDACSPGLKSWYSAKVYHIQFAENIPSTVDQGMIISSDVFTSKGAQIRNNVFNMTTANLGRMKSIDGVIESNYLGYSCGMDLEVGPLVNYIEGPLGINGVSITKNTIQGSGSSPFRVYDSLAQITGNTILP